MQKFFNKILMAIMALSAVLLYTGNLLIVNAYHALFKNIIIQQKIIQSNMKHTIFIIPRFHWSF